MGSRSWVWLKNREKREIWEIPEAPKIPKHSETSGLRIFRIILENGEISAEVVLEVNEVSEVGELGVLAGPLRFVKERRRRGAAKPNVQGPKSKVEDGQRDAGGTLRGHAEKADFLNTEHRTFNFEHRMMRDREGHARGVVTVRGGV